MAPARRGFASWYDKVAAFNVESLFAAKKGVRPPRTVYVNEPLPASYFDHKGRPLKDHVYPTNQVITSKYTVITFLPRNLLEQFRRVANIFFLGIAILQFFSKFSTISPGLVILPLLIVIGITAAKDGYEDVKRHQSDRRVNHSQVRVLAGGDWTNVNVTGNKSKTFTRGIGLPAGAAGTSSKKDGKTRPKASEANGDLESTAGAPLDHPAPTRDTAIEYDDEALTEEHHVLPHHHEKRPHWRRTLWEDVRVGDFVKILDHEAFPADILICATSEDENVAFVETKNLDGETNLKSRNAVPELTHLRSAAVCASPANRFRVDLDKPDNNLYKMTGAVVVDQEGKAEPLMHPVDMQMTLLRGTVLRNTAWVIGVVIYTGVDAKIVLNSGGTPSKRSKVERQMNPQVFINLLLLALMAIGCGIADSVLEINLAPKGAPWLYEDTLTDDNPHINGLVTWAFALITFQNIVPISLYISIEFVRTIQALWIYFDKEIWYEKTDQATLARSWNLSDDLGQIEYIFSDKTGTLTQNSMVFRQCSVGGKVYKGDEVSDDPAHSDITEVDRSAGDVNRIDVKSVQKDSDAPIDIRFSSASSSSGIPNKDLAVPDPKTASKVKLPGNVAVRFHDAVLAEDLTDAVSADPQTENAPRARALNGFFSVLALCHTVLTTIDPETGAIEYKAQSPDEAALVQAAADVGFVFRGREREILHLQTPFSDAIERYELLNILEFTSARKRMSVIVRKVDGAGADGRLFLMCKGADNVIFDRLRQGKEDEIRTVTGRHLDGFANEGLRTLTLAYKVIPEAEYEEWSERYHQASVAIDNREALVEEVSNEIEQDLRLLGATAIEDKLQDGVPETIADLKRAGIKVWVATGDKLETAIAIGHTTNLIGKESNIIIIRGGNDSSRPIYQQMLQAVEEFFPESDILNDPAIIDANVPEPTTPARPGALRRVATGVSDIVGTDNGNRPGGFVLVIDGSALGYALGDDEHKALLLRLATLCEGVICCRVSPLQKALVVKLVKDGLGAMTLAIGDGANDVSMIQAADVGVGISGEEGLQAVNSSDYAIAQFRYLKRLLLVHGHWSYARNGNMILNFFYKNIVCIGVLWWFQIYCGWSSNYAFDYTYLLFWNSFWTIAPVIAMGLFDRMVDADVLMAMPELYHFGREGQWFGLRPFCVYMLDGVYQSAVIFFVILYGYFSPTARADGWDVGLFEFSTTMVLAAVFAANFTNGLNTHVWTGWVFFAVFIGILLIWLFTVVYSAISPGWFYTDVFGNNHFLFRSAYFWLCLPLTVLFALLPRYVALAWKSCFTPDDLDTMRWIRKVHPERDITRDVQRGSALAALRRPVSRMSRPSPRASRPASRLTSRSSRAPSRMSRSDSVGDISLAPRRPSMDTRAGSRTDMSTGVRSIHRGFDFSTEEHGVQMRRMQSNLSERRQSSRHLPIDDASESRKHSLFHLRSLRRKKPPTPKKTE
ncbi:hypothetical protein PLICRDRAFT_175835 [Plicaturopsis crispa FD-325 SS-3]|nr:hypothetical protein PLICRDRAFT_175835 [Plicaturopsis crispa FD-325 SS-3]